MRDRAGHGVQLCCHVKLQHFVFFLPQGAVGQAGTGVHRHDRSYPGQFHGN